MSQSGRDWETLAIRGSTSSEFAASLVGLQVLGVFCVVYLSSFVGSCS